MKWNEFCAGHENWTFEELMVNIGKIEAFGTNDEVFAAARSLKDKHAGSVLMHAAASRGVVFTKAQSDWMLEGQKENTAGSPYHTKDDVAKMATDTLIDAVTPTGYNYAMSGVDEPEEFAKREAINIAEDAAQYAVNSVSGMGFWGWLLSSLGITGLFRSLRRKNDNQNKNRPQ